MERTGFKKFRPEVCGFCGQTTEYPIRIDKGSALIVIAIAKAVRNKGQNKIHLRNEMLVKKGMTDSAYSIAMSGKMTSTMIDNVLRPKYFGLVAQVDGGGGGEYLLTPRGAKFLRGESIPALAAIDKIKHMKKCYIDEQTERTTIRQLLKSDVPFWDLEWEIDEQSLALKRKVASDRAAAPQASLL
jgi:hypothetical protein